MRQHHHPSYPHHALPVGGRFDTAWRSIALNAFAVISPWPHSLVRPLRLVSVSVARTPPQEVSSLAHGRDAPSLDRYEPARSAWSLVTERRFLPYHLSLRITSRGV